MGGVLRKRLDLTSTRVSTADGGLKQSMFVLCESPFDTLMSKSPTSDLCPLCKYLMFKSGPNMKKRNWYGHS